VVLPTLTRLGYDFARWDNTPTTMPDSDIIVKAKWTPLEVNYKIEVYKENADDDGYTLVSEETKTALAGSNVRHDEPMHSKPQEFILNPDHPNSVLEAIVEGDGTTVLKVYYTRALITVEINYNSLKPNESKT